MKKTPRNLPHRTVDLIASHVPFPELVDFCVRGRANPVLKSHAVDDHIAELCELLLDDTDDYLWLQEASAESITARNILTELSQQIDQRKNLSAAKTLYAIATQAVYEILRLYLRHRELFDQIAPRRKLLPFLFSIHPRTASVAAQMRKDARLGEQTEHSRQAASRAWFLSDTPANIYARAIVTSVRMNQKLDPRAKQQASWAEYDRLYGVRTVVLPFPKYVAGLEAIPIPITPRSVPQYWRKGKEMMLEEMPDFHSRPEWKSYHARRYAGGAKKGAVQHAIFKDILTALRTIAGANKRKSASLSKGA